MVKLHSQSHFVQPLHQALLVEVFDLQWVVLLVGPCHNLAVQVHGYLGAGALTQLRTQAGAVLRGKASGQDAVLDAVYVLDVAKTLGYHANDVIRDQGIGSVLARGVTAPVDVRHNDLGPAEARPAENEICF